MKEEKFTHTRKPLNWPRGRVAGGSFRTTEDSPATGVQKAKRRDSRTEDQCQPALTSPRVLSADPPAKTGGSWELWLQLLWRSNPRERTGVGCMNTA